MVSKKPTTASKKPNTARKKPSTARKKSTAKRPATLRSFKNHSEEQPFMTFKFTKQSLYWLVLSMVVLAIGVWVLYLNIKVHNIYDQVDIANASISSMELKNLQTERP